MTAHTRLTSLYLFVRAMPAWLAMAGRGSYLRSSGWLASRLRGMPLDCAGEPIPWITYPSLVFLQQRVRHDMSVFEFGSGASTLWWAKRVRRVVSCEHDESWFARTRATVPAHVHLSHVPLEEQQYAREILRYPDSFDIIVIDGRDRIECARNSIGALRAGGVILWDNSDRSEYQPAYEMLHSLGFRRLDFVGMGPLNEYQWGTTIFYRDGNCLGI
jgi:precorrin-6B methylase 2